MMEQRRGHHGGMIEFKRLSLLAFERTIEPMEVENRSLRWRKHLEFLNALRVRKWLMQPICCVEMFMTGGG